MPSDVDVTRKLAEAKFLDEYGTNWGTPAERANHIDGEMETARAFLARLTALAAAHPEDVAREMGLTVRCQKCKGEGIFRASQACTCGGIDIGVGTMHEPDCGMDRCDCTYLPADLFVIAAAPKEPHG